MGLKPKVPGLVKGLGVTFNTMMTTFTKGAQTDAVRTVRIWEALNSATDDTRAATRKAT